MAMRFRILVFLFAFFFSTRLLDVPAAATESDPPLNVLLILADDLGWSDTTLFGTTRFYRTPNMERLAARGMTFTRAYSSSPLCSPTRASILTGLSPARHGITAPQCHLPEVILEPSVAERAAPDCKSIQTVSASRLDPRHYTLAEALRDAGYVTGHFGKWHLGPEPYSPLQHGFDVDVPHWPGPGPAGSYLAPWKFPDFDHDPDLPHEHIEDRMAKEAVSFMEQNRDKPFFLNYWMFSVHAPFDAKPDRIELYRERVDPRDPQRCPTYAAMIESMDDAVGTLLDTLDRLGLAERTVILFASDNGGNMYNEVEGETPTSNAPLRGGKATVYEGGVRGPCCVVWPGVVPVGSRSDEMVQSSDFYPTLLEITGIAPREGQRFDGISLVPALRGQTLGERAIFTYFPHQPRVPEWLPPSISVHQGDWKLIRIFHGGEDGAHRWKLFNLQDDLGEQHDLAGQLPERVREMDALIEAFLTETAAVRPVANPAFNSDMYRPELEGVQIQPKAAGGADRQRYLGKPVAGWRANQQAQLQIDRGQLLITSKGSDPHLSFELPNPLQPGKYVLHLSMTAEAQGKGQWFWQEQGSQPPFFRDRSVTFDLHHDGRRHDYLVEFACQSPMVAVRLDPGQAAGSIRIHSLELRDPDGKSVYSWQWTRTGAR